MKVLALAAPGCALLLVLIPAGCGGEGTASVDTPAPRSTVGSLDGAEVGTMAERELESQNPTLAPGTMACPDLDLDVGASVRCLRVTELSGGRVVKVRGTVEVTSLDDGGRLHVAMDDEAEEFGLSGRQLASDLRRQYVQRFRSRPSRVRCPYLRGEVGTRVSCRLVAGGKRLEVGVVVTAVDADSYRTHYADDLPAAS